MTEETRAELRRGIEAVVRASVSDVDDDGVRASNMPVTRGLTGGPVIGQVVSVRVRTSTVDADTIPPLTTAQQLALSVLVGEPDRVVLSALCDLLIEQGHEYAVECFRKGVESVNPFSEMVKAMTPAMSAYAEAMAELGQRVAEMVAVSASVTNDAQPT